MCKPSNRLNELVQPISSDAAIRPPFRMDRARVDIVLPEQPRDLSLGDPAFASVFPPFGFRVGLQARDDFLRGQPLSASADCSGDQGVQRHEQADTVRGLDRTTVGQDDGGASGTLGPLAPRKLGNGEQQPPVHLQPIVEPWWIFWLDGLDGSGAVGAPPGELSAKLLEGFAVPAVKVFDVFVLKLRPHLAPDEARSRCWLHLPAPHDDNFRAEHLEEYLLAIDGAGD